MANPRDVANRRLQLSSTLQLAPTLLEATAGHVASTIGNGSGTAGGVGASRGVLATQAAIAGVVPIHHVAGTATTDVVNWCGAAKIALEFFIEAEHGAFAGAVDVAGATTARGKSRRSARVEACQRGRTCGGARVGSLGILQADDISGSSTAGVNGRSTGMRHRRMRLNNAVI